jgi:uncharacterized protein
LVKYSSEMSTQLEESILQIGCFVFFSLTILFHIFKNKIGLKKPAEELISFYLISFLTVNTITLIGLSILKESFIQDSFRSLPFLLTFMMSPALITFYFEPFQYISLKNILGNFKSKFLWFGIFTIISTSILNPIVSSFFWSDVKFSISAETLLSNLKFMKLDEAQQTKIKDQFNLNPILLIILMSFQSIIGGCTINTLFAYGEERAWRYFVIKRISSLGFGFWSTCWISGFLWGLWHYPIILLGYNFPHNHFWGVLFMSISCMLITPLFLYFSMVVNSSPFSLTASILHGMLNATAGFSMVMISGGIDLQNAILGSSCWILFTIINFLLYFVDNEVNQKFQKIIWV